MADDYTWTPSYTSNVKERARVHGITFGDGYEQVAPAGINSISITVDVVHEHLLDSELTAILTLLRARKGVSYFIWTPPIVGFNTTRKFRCDEWTVKPQQYNDSSLTATFREVFDI